MGNILNLINLRPSNLNIINRANEFYFFSSRLIGRIRLEVIEHDRFVLTKIELKFNSFTERI